MRMSYSCLSTAGLAVTVLVSSVSAQTAPLTPGPGKPAGNQVFSVSSASTPPSTATYGSAYSTPLRPGFAFTPPPTPVFGPGLYGGYNYFGGGFGNSSMGYMLGASSLLNSFGTYAMDIQQSRLTGQEVERSRIDTRRKKWDQWLYERATRPTENDERERTRMLELQRAMGNPPESEIWSGKALNDILDSIKRVQSPGMPTPFVPVDQETLSRLNLRASGSEGNFGLLKDGGTLQWPFALQAPAFTEFRNDISKLFQRAANEANVGAVGFETINGLEEKLGALDEELSRMIRSSEISASRAIQARRYIKEVQQSTRALQDPNVTQYAQKKWAARGNSVSDLVNEMSRNGLRFAPAVRGDQPAYFAMHKAMVDYKVALLRLVGGPGPQQAMGPNNQGQP